ncbi:MAG TPA: hypothetical protein VND23_06825 [Acidimicrobiales bacterium]|nr:hypothetical protein [Acidimicrobiales bacterium]
MSNLHYAPRRSRLRRVLRGVAASVVSLATVAVAAAYVVAPTRTAFAVTIGTEPNAVPGVELLYGRVTGPAGAPLVHARLLVERDGRVVARLTTGPLGTYRQLLRLGRGAYELVLSARAGGRSFVHRMRVVFVPGRRYRVSGRLLPQRVFTFLPVASY